MAAKIIDSHIIINQILGLLETETLTQKYILLSFLV